MSDTYKTRSQDGSKKPNHADWKKKRNPSTWKLRNSRLLVELQSPGQPSVTVTYLEMLDPKGQEVRLYEAKDTYGRRLTASWEMWHKMTEQISEHAEMH